MNDYEEGIFNDIYYGIQLLCLSFDHEKHIIPKKAIRPYSKDDEYDYIFDLKRLSDLGLIKPEGESYLASRWAFRWKITSKSLITAVGFQERFLLFKGDRSKLKEYILDDILECQDKKDSSNFQSGKNTYGQTKEKDPDKICFNLGNVNIGLAFHPNFLQDLFWANAIANLYQNAGHLVTRTLFIEDLDLEYGIQAFAWKKYQPSGLSIKNLNEAYFKLDSEHIKVEYQKNKESKTLDKAFDEVKKIYDGDQEAIDLWKRIKNYWLEMLKMHLKKMNIQVDQFIFQSDYQSQSQSFLDDLDRRELLLSDRDSKRSYIRLRKNHGRPVYSDNITFDNGCIEEFSFYLMNMINVFEKEKYDRFITTCSNHHQKKIYKDLKTVLDLMNKSYTVEIDIIHLQESVSLLENPDNSSILVDPKDQGFYISELFELSEQKILSEIKKESRINIKSKEKAIANQLGVFSIIIDLLSNEKTNLYKFNWNDITSFRGYTGLNVLLTQAKIESIFTRVKQIKGNQYKINLNVDYEILKKPIEIKLIKILGEYPYVVSQALQCYEPNKLIEYLYDLTYVVTQNIEMVGCITILRTGQTELAEARIFLLWCSNIIIKNILNIIGVKPIKGLI